MKEKPLSQKNSLDQITLRRLQVDAVEVFETPITITTLAGDQSVTATELCREFCKVEVALTEYEGEDRETAWKSLCNQVYPITEFIKHNLIDNGLYNLGCGVRMPKYRVNAQQLRGYGITGHCANIIQMCEYILWNNRHWRNDIVAYLFARWYQKYLKDEDNQDLLPVVRALRAHASRYYSEV